MILPKIVDVLFPPKSTSTIFDSAMQIDLKQQLLGDSAMQLVKTSVTDSKNYMKTMLSDLAPPHSTFSDTLRKHLRLVPSPRPSASC